MSYDEIVRGACPWQGVLDTSVMVDDLVRASHRLADTAKAGNWPAVMEVLDQEWKWLVINQWRPGGTAWFTALHQAAWHGAPREVVAELIERVRCGAFATRRGVGLSTWQSSATGHPRCWSCCSRHARR